MFDRLPIELALAIFREAADVFAVSDHRSAVYLAKTSKLVYTSVRPILLRRVTVTDSNKEAAEDLLRRDDSAAFIRDLNLVAANWYPSSQLFCNLTRLCCLRGHQNYFKIVIAGLPSAGRESLFKLQFWDYHVVHTAPVNVTHICVYADNDLKDQATIINWVTGTPSLTHLGIEFVSLYDSKDDVLPDKLMKGLHELFGAGGQRLRKVSIRLCGPFTAPEKWSRYLEALQQVDDGRPEWSQRVHLWRDDRRFQDWNADSNASITDARAGVDVWSEACPFVSFI